MGNGEEGSERGDAASDGGTAPKPGPAERKRTRAKGGGANQCFSGRREEKVAAPRVRRSFHVCFVFRAGSSEGRKRSLSHLLRLLLRAEGEGKEKGMRGTEGEGLLPGRAGPPEGGTAPPADVADFVGAPGGVGAPLPSPGAGVKLRGPRHVFTVVPVVEPCGRDEGKEEAAPLLKEEEAHVPRASPPSFHYNTVRGPCVARGRAPCQLPLLLGPASPYHTVSGAVPYPFRRAEGASGGGPFRVPSVAFSRRQYGVGGGSTSLFPLATAGGHVATVTGTATGRHVPLVHVFDGQQRLSRQADDPKMAAAALLSPPPDDVVDDPQFTVHSDQLTVHSGQLTVHSAVHSGVDVGSTDGRNVKVRGTVRSPEAIPHIPPVQRHGLKEDGSGRKDKKARQTWGNKAQFMLACIGSAVGLGNLWRFPYLCYKSGGGAFLIPYFVMLFLCGIPLLLMELAVGQYTHKGPIAAMEKISPLFKGAGVGTVVISFLLSTYYNVIIAWAIFYFVQSFSTTLPWSSCNATWAISCFDDYGSNVTAPNGTKSPTEEFFDEVVLQKSEGIHEMGSMRIELLLALFTAWVLVYFSLWKSVKSTGRVVYVTATLPYLLIGAFLWRALTLPGATIGLQYFFDPQWELLLEADVWVNAAAQNFNSIGIAFGSLIAYASYNKFNNNIIVDTWAISLINSFTSMMAGMIVFSTLGNIAEELGKDIEDVVAEGPGLVFMVYPQALAKMPQAAVWAVLFFLMLLILGLDSQFATVEVIVTSLQDGFPKWIQKYLKHHEILVLVICFVSFVFGLPNIMQGGIYFFQLIDYYAAAISLMYLAFFEVVAIVWVYGAGRLARNVREMTGRMPSQYFRFCWYFTAPLLIVAIWVFSMVDYKQPTYNKGEYEFPDWAIGIGWLISSLSIVPIPIFAVIAIIKAKGTNFLEKLKNSVRSPIDECPCCGRAYNCLDEGHNHGGESLGHSLKLVAYNSHENIIDKVTPTQENSVEMRESKMNGENAI